MAGDTDQSPGSTPLYDAIVIGGGPGGSAVAGYLRKAGRSVLVLEKERFPRFHIGESLLPYNARIFKELGLMPKLEAAGLIRKWGAQFHIANGAKSLKLVFRKGRFTHEPMAFQVERAQFDALLLRHAAQMGADVREECSVCSYSVGADAVTVEAQRAGGSKATFRGRYLIDASGRSNFTGNIENLREVHPSLKKLAVFGHFSGVAVDEGESRGDTVIVRLGDKWFWIIPLNDEKTSVGCVMDAEEFARARKPAEVVFNEIVQSSAVPRERMASARLLGSIHTTGDFSYKNRTFTSPRVLRVGDAAAFMDPIFSAGVYMAMYSGRAAAHTVDRAIKAGNDPVRGFAAYEKRVHNAMKTYWWLVEGYYTDAFMDLFMEPRDRMSLPAAVTAVLAGEVEGGWKIAWRLLVFRTLARLQRKVPLVPRIDFREGLRSEKTRITDPHEFSTERAG